MSESRSAMQESQYGYPYHYIPYMDASGPRISRALSWGLEYLAYQSVIRGLVLGERPDSVLEVGCGDGRLIGSLAGHVTHCMGVDPSKRAIAFAQAFNPGVRFMAEPVESVAGTFDVVVAVEVLEHIPDDGVPGFLQSMAGRVRRGGTLLVSVPTNVSPVHPKHFRHYDEATLAADFERAGLPARAAAFTWVYEEGWLLRWYRRATINRFWTLEVGGLQNLVWRIVRSRCLYARKGRGRHLVAAVKL